MRPVIPTWVCPVSMEMPPPAAAVAAGIPKAEPGRPTLQVPARPYGNKEVARVMRDGTSLSPSMAEGRVQSQGLMCEGSAPVWSGHPGQRICGAASHGAVSGTREEGSLPSFSLFSPLPAPRAH